MKPFEAYIKIELFLYKYCILIIKKMSVEIETDKSSLVLHVLDERMREVIKNCVESVDDVLDINPEIIIYGKVCNQRRSVGFFSNTSRGYNYRNTNTPAKEMNDYLIELLNYINEKFDYDYNGILINKYGDGNDYIGKHSDDMKGLDDRVGVVAISYGAIRKFRIRNKSTNNIVKDIPTDPSYIIQMNGKFQNEFTHEIPVEKKVKDIRYSFTFRKHLV